MDQAQAASRIALRPHDPSTGEEIEREQVVKGYEYQRGQFVTFTPEELEALDVESSKVIDLEKFIPRGELDPVYFDRPYYLYPDGPIAIETLRVIGAAMAEAGVVGLGRLTLSRRERMVMVEPRGTGMALFTLRTADQVRAAQFPSAEGELDPEMVAIARAMIAAADRQIRSGHLPRPLPGCLARADRGQGEGATNQTARSQRACAGNRFDGGFETQSRARSAGEKRRDEDGEASQGGC
jgi:Ku protein